LICHHNLIDFDFVRYSFITATAGVGHC